MAKSFISGHKYVLSPKKYLKDVKKHGMKPTMFWVKKANGRYIDIEKSQTTNGYTVNSLWCKEVR